MFFNKDEVNNSLACAIKKHVLLYQLGIPAKFWVRLQAEYDYDRQAIMQRDIEEQKAQLLIAEYNQKIDVNLLLRKVKSAACTFKVNIKNNNAMKKILFSLLALLITTSVFSQRVISDTMVDDSTRIVSTSHMICRTFTDRLVLAVGLTAFKCNDKVYYAIDAQVTTLSPSTIPDNGRMLIKNNDGNVIELATTRSEVSTSSKWYGNTTVNRIGNTYYVNRPSISTSTASASYFISEEDLLSTFNGVKKIRIEIEPTKYDKEFKKDLVGSTLKNEYNLLKTKLGDNKSSDASFKEGF